LGYADISFRDLSDTSNYNSLQTTLNRRFSNGLSFGVAYTFSKTMDKVGAGASAGGNLGGNTAQDSYNPRNEMARASIDSAHIFTVSYIYALPFFLKSSNRFERAVLGDWEISGITSAQSGFPFTVTVPVDVARIGVASSRATLVGDPNLSRDERTPARWFNTAAFLPASQMTPGRFGTTGRNMLRGAGFQNWDLSLIKRFAVHERLNIEFRAESFNTFNHTNFTSINTTVAFDANANPTSGFGSVNASGPGRSLEFGLKLRF